MTIGFGIGFKQWATHHLQSGDLTALSAIAGGSRSDEARVKRLMRRGFIAERGDGRIAVTPRGRMALIVRRLTRRG